MEHKRGGRIFKTKLQAVHYLVLIRRLPRLSRSIHFGDVYETYKNSFAPRDPKRIMRGLGKAARVSKEQRSG